LKSSIFWDIISSISLKVNRHFGGIRHLYLQPEALLAACFMLGSRFYPEDVDPPRARHSTFLNVGNQISFRSAARIMVFVYNKSHDLLLFGLIRKILGLQTSCHSIAETKSRVPGIDINCHISISLHLLTI
jgi:hypothetical protein